MSYSGNPHQKISDSVIIPKKEQQVYNSVPFLVTSNTKICKECGEEFRYNVVRDRRTGSKYLRTGCCDLAIRPCPDPEALAKSPHLSQDEQDYLNGLIPLPWFNAKAVAMLLQMEAKVKQATEVEV
ncbi:hypothetical protein [Tolypothrix sp. VBCCA 56010]|uniref:hypothetical protein n=1 Tax=Tolypothrix sp. VBCCA 56010 TaxID=3137731 RepID=UPI003D7CCB9C